MTQTRGAPLELHASVLAWAAGDPGRFRRASTSQDPAAPVVACLQHPHAGSGVTR